MARWNLVGVPYPAARPLSGVQVQAAGGATRLITQAVGLGLQGSAVWEGNLRADAQPPAGSPTCLA